MGGLTKLEELRRQKMERNRKALLAMVDEQPQASSVQRQIKESAAAPPTARPKKRKLRRAERVVRRGNFATYTTCVGINGAPDGEERPIGLTPYARYLTDRAALEMEA